MRKHSEYTALCRAIAQEHAAIRHGESGKNAFGRLILDSDPMGEDYIREYLQTAKNMSYPLLLSCSYDQQGREPNSDFDKVDYNPSIIILVQADSTDFDAIEHALDLAQTIAENCLAYITTFLINKYPNNYYRIRSWNIEKIGPVQSPKVIGARLNFTISAPAQDIVTDFPQASFPETDPDKWIEL